MRAGVLAAALVVGLATQAAAQSEQFLDAAGTRYAVNVGQQKDLFPTDPTALNTAMAVDITRPGQPTERLLVPGTETADVESNPYFWVDDSGTLFVLWEAEGGFLVKFFLRSLRDGAWSPAVMLYGNWVDQISTPQIVMTRDVIRVPDGAGGAVDARRTILHLVWWENGDDGGRVLYSPVVLVNGQYQGEAQPIAVLNDLDSDAGIADTRVTADLYRSPRLQTGRDDKSVVVGFANPRNGHLATVEALVMPADLETLVDDVRAHIITGGLQWTPGDSSSLAEALRAHIITGGRTGRLSSGVVNFLVESLRAHIITGGLASSGRDVIAADVKDFLLQNGAALLENGLSATNDARSLMIEQTLAGSNPDGPGTPAALVRVRMVSSRTAPLTGAAANTSLFLSQDGERVVAAWEGDTVVRYRESSDDGWTAPMVLRLGPQLSRDAAFRMLLDRVRGR